MSCRVLSRYCGDRHGRNEGPPAMLMTNKPNSALALVLSTVLTAACHRTTTPAPRERVPSGDWPSYGRTVAGDRFSPLAQIERANVARLSEVCAYELPEVAALQTGPLVIDGTMFFTTDTISYAIDGFD